MIQVITHWGLGSDGGSRARARRDWCSTSITRLLRAGQSAPQPKSCRSLGWLISDSEGKYLHRAFQKRIHATLYYTEVLQHRDPVSHSAATFFLGRATDERCAIKVHQADLVVPEPSADVE